MKAIYPKFLDRTPVIVKITEGMSENGDSSIVVTYTGKCNYSEKSKTTRGKDGAFVRLEGSLTIGTDIAPGVEQLVGSVELFGRSYKIFKGSRIRNPDGSVNHTKLELV